MKYRGLALASIEGKDRKEYDISSSLWLKQRFLTDVYFGIMQIESTMAI
jgi:hypothetical protein